MGSGVQTGLPPRQTPKGHHSKCQGYGSQEAQATEDQNHTLGRVAQALQAEVPQKLNTSHLTTLYAPPQCKQHIFLPTLQNQVKACFWRALWQASWDPSDMAATGKDPSDRACGIPSTFKPSRASLQGPTGQHPPLGKSSDQPAGTKYDPLKFS